MSIDFKPSKPAAVMLSAMLDMDETTLEWFNDMGMGISSTLEEITAIVENPPTTRVEGCEVIQLGSDLFIPIKVLKQRLDAGGLEFEDYIRELDRITERLDQVVQANKEVISNPRVRNHMKQLTNVVILHLEAGPVLNTMFGILGRYND
jgi:hypothetical protein